MSHLYPTLKGKLMEWALNGGAPFGSSLWVAGVNSGYVYDAAHSYHTDIAAHVEMDGGPVPNVTNVNGLVGGNGLTIGPTIVSNSMIALIVYLKWGSGSQLCCYIDQAVDFAFPYTFDDTDFSVRWNEAGIFQI